MGVRRADMDIHTWLCVPTYILVTSDVMHYLCASRNQLWIGGAKVYWEGWTKTTLISNEINKDRIHTYRLQWAN